MVPGTTRPEDILASVKQGLYVTDLIGFGINMVTGDYSRGASGFWIENGRLAFPVTEVNVSGQMEAMLAGVDATGTDLSWFGSSAAPTIRIKEMMVAGT